MPFRDGLHEAFAFAIAACLLAALTSLMRGGRYHYEEDPPEAGSAGRADGQGDGERLIIEAHRSRPRQQEEQHAS